MIGICVKIEERRENDEGIIMTIEKEEINRKKKKQRKIKTKNLTELVVYRVLVR